MLTTLAPGGWVQLHAQGVISAGDKLIYEVDPKTHAARVTVNAVGKKLVAKIENYDYKR